VELATGGPNEVVLYCAVTQPWKAATGVDPERPESNTFKSAEEHNDE
jgi:hypothetical protein